MQQRSQDLKDQSVLPESKRQPLTSGLKNKDKTTVHDKKSTELTALVKKYIPIDKPITGLADFKKIIERENLKLNQRIFREQTSDYVTLFSELAGWNGENKIYEEELIALLQHPEVCLQPLCGQNVFFHVAKQEKYKLIEDMLQYGVPVNQNIENLLELVPNHDEIKTVKENPVEMNKALTCINLLLSAPNDIHFPIVNKKAQHTLFSYICHESAFDGYVNIRKLIWTEIQLRIMQKIARKDIQTSDQCKNELLKIYGLSSSDRLQNFTQVLNSVTQWLNKDNVSTQDIPEEVLAFLREMGFQQNACLSQHAAKEKNRFALQSLLMTDYVRADELKNQEAIRGTISANDFSLASILLANIPYPNFKELFSYALKCDQHQDHRFGILRLLIEYSNKNPNKNAITLQDITEAYFTALKNKQSRTAAVLFRQVLFNLRFDLKHIQPHADRNRWQKECQAYLVKKLHLDPLKNFTEIQWQQISSWGVLTIFSEARHNLDIELYEEELVHLIYFKYEKLGVFTLPCELGALTLSNAKVVAAIASLVSLKNTSLFNEVSIYQPIECRVIELVATLLLYLKTNEVHAVAKEGSHIVQEINNLLATIRPIDKWISAIERSTENWLLPLVYNNVWNCSHPEMLSRLKFLLLNTCFSMLSSIPKEKRSYHAYDLLSACSLELGHFPILNKEKILQNAIAYLIINIDKDYQKHLKFVLRLFTACIMLAEYYKSKNVNEPQKAIDCFDPVIEHYQQLVSQCDTVEKQSIVNHLAQFVMEKSLYIVKNQHNEAVLYKMRKTALDLFVARCPEEAYQLAKFHYNLAVIMSWQDSQKKSESLMHFRSAVALMIEHKPTAKRSQSEQFFLNDCRRKLASCILMDLKKNAKQHQENLLYRKTLWLEAEMMLGANLLENVDHFKYCEIDNITLAFKLYCEWYPNDFTKLNAFSDFLLAASAFRNFKNEDHTQFISAIKFIADIALKNGVESFHLVKKIKPLLEMVKQDASCKILYATCSQLIDAAAGLTNRLTAHPVESKRSSQQPQNSTQQPSAPQVTLPARVPVPAIPSANAFSSTNPITSANGTGGAVKNQFSADYKANTQLNHLKERAANYLKNIYKNNQSKLLSELSKLETKSEEELKQTIKTLQEKMDATAKLQKQHPKIKTRKSGQIAHLAESKGSQESQQMPACDPAHSAFKKPNKAERNRLFRERKAIELQQFEANQRRENEIKEIKAAQQNMARYQRNVNLVIDRFNHRFRRLQISHMSYFAMPIYPDDTVLDFDRVSLDCLQDEKTPEKAKGSSHQRMSLSQFQRSGKE